MPQRKSAWFHDGGPLARTARFSRRTKRYARAESARAKARDSIGSAPERRLLDIGVLVLPGKEEPMQMAWIDRARGLLRGERVASAQSYDDAREQLDGAAWREVPKSTDAWFVVDEPEAPAAVVEPPLRRRISVIAGTACAVLLLSGVVVWAAHRPAAPTVATSVASAPEATQAPPVAQPIPQAAASALPTNAAPPERALALAAASPVKKVRAKHSRRHR
jgi:hypothetical protein